MAHEELKGAIKGYEWCLILIQHTLSESEAHPNCEARERWALERLIATIKGRILALRKMVTE